MDCCPHASKQNSVSAFGFLVVHPHLAGLVKRTAKQITFDSVTVIETNSFSAGQHINLFFSVGREEIPRSNPRKEKKSR